MKPLTRLHRLLTLGGATLMMCGAVLVPLRPATADAPRPKSAAVQSYTRVQVLNRTEHRIAIYLDREYRGTVEPYGQLIVDVLSGETEFFGRARCCDSTWGPTVRDIEGTFIWRLTE